MKSGLTVMVDGWDSAPKGRGYLVNMVAVSNWSGELATSLKSCGLTPSLALVGTLRVGMTRQQVAKEMGFVGQDLMGSAAHTDAEMILRSGKRKSDLALRFNWDKKNALQTIQVSIGTGP